MRTRLRRTLARQLRTLARRLDPTPHSHTEHVHLTIRADTSGMVEALERSHRKINQLHYRGKPSTRCARCGRHIAAEFWTSEGILGSCCVHPLSHHPL